MSEQQKEWQRYEARQIKRAAAAGPEAKESAENSMSFFRDLGHDGKPMGEEMRDVIDTLHKDGAAAAKTRSEFWQEKARERVETAEKVLRSHEQERDR